MSTSGQQERLESWKQIAAYLGKSERTVRRWQQAEGLPVHRHQHQQRGSVWAYQEELDGWLQGRRLSPEPLKEAEEPRSKSIVLWAGVLAGLAAVVLGIWVTSRRAPVVRVLDTVPLTATPGASYGPSFSPDGKRVVFFFAPLGSGSGRQGLYLKTIGSDDVTPLVAKQPLHMEFSYGPAWSPDGKTIAFLRRLRPATHAEGSETWLYLVSPDGGPERRLMQVSDGAILYANHMHLSWTPDSQWVVAPMAVGERKGIHRISVRNAEVRQLTVAEKLDYGAQLSPDGRALVYLRQEGPPGAAVESVLRQDLAADGRPFGPVRTLYKGRSLSSGLAWTASGKDLIFCNSTNAFFGPFNSRLFLLRGEPGHAPVLLESSDCSTVTVSRPGPSGKAMLLYASGGNEKARIHAASLGSLAEHTAFAASTRFDALPSYSPDGTKVAFLSNRSGMPEAWVAKSDGTEARKLTENARVWSGPRWSPDGMRLVYGAAREAGSVQHALFVVAAEGGRPHRIPMDEPYASNPVWAEDGENIYFWSYSSSRQRSLWKVAAQGGRAVLVGNYDANFQQQSMVAGGYLYYARNAFPFGLSRISLGDGREEVLAQMSSAYFAVTQRFVYFVRRGDRVLCALPIAGGPMREHGEMPVFEGVRRLILGMTVSPDEAAILWGVTGEQQLDLQLVRDFSL